MQLVVVLVNDVSDGHITLVNQVIDSAHHAAELSVLSACTGGGIRVGIKILVKRNNAAALVTSSRHDNVHVSMLIFCVIVYVEETCFPGAQVLGRFRDFARVARH